MLFEPSLRHSLSLGRRRRAYNEALQDKQSLPAPPPIVQNNYHERTSNSVFVFGTVSRTTRTQERPRARAAAAAAAAAVVVAVADEGDDERGKLQEGGGVEDR